MGALLDSVRTSLFGVPAPAPTSVVSGVRSAGMSFATLIEKVGVAVAETQGELDTTAGKIATAMAQTQINTVQAVVSRYDNSGNLTDVEVITGPTTALAIAVPPALSFKEVVITGSFQATEMSSTSTANVNVNLSGFSVGTQGGLRGLSVSAGTVNSNTNLDTQVTQSSSIGSMTVTAQISPKPVEAIDKAPLIFKGPTLSLAVSSIPQPVVVHALPVAPTDPPYLERRQAIILIKLVDSTNAGVNGMTIAIDCGDLGWIVTDSSGNPPTSAPFGPVTSGSGSNSGEVYITVDRTATSPTDGKTAYLIRGSLNLLNASCSVSL